MVARSRGAYSRERDRSTGAGAVLARQIALEPNDPHAELGASIACAGSGRWVNAPAASETHEIPFRVAEEGHLLGFARRSEATFVVHVNDVRL